MKKSMSPLDRMTAQAMTHRPPTTIHLRGAHAKKFHNFKPGQKFKAQMHGTVQSTGMDQYNGNEPTAELSLSHVAPAEMEPDQKDKNEQNEGE